MVVHGNLHDPAHEVVAALDDAQIRGQQAVRIRQE
jgi:hypothetical protein